jgi:hypothetical protein
MYASLRFYEKDLSVNLDGQIGADESTERATGALGVFAIL